MQPADSPAPASPAPTATPEQQQNAGGKTENFQKQEPEPTPFGPDARDATFGGEVRRILDGATAAYPPGTKPDVAVIISASLDIYAAYRRIIRAANPVSAGDSGARTTTTELTTPPAGGRAELPR